MQAQDIHQRLLAGIAAAKVAQQKPARTPRDRERLKTDDLVKYRLRARELLREVVDHDPTNINAWLWLSTVMDSLAEKARCLENVLALEPNNKQALAGLDWIARSDPSVEIIRPIPPSPQATRKISHFFDDEFSHLDPTRPASASFMGQDVVDSSEIQETVIQSNCPFCNQLISQTDTTCSHCDLPLVVECPACSTLMDVEWENCHACGYAMGNYQFGSMYFAHLALCYQKNKQPKKAMNAILIAEKMDPEQPDLYRIKGEIQHELGQIQAAIDTLEKAVGKEPEQVAPYISLGKALKQEGKWRRAEEIFREAMRIAPKSSEPHYALGDLMWQQGKTKKAQKHLQHALKLDSMHGLAWARIGEIREAANKRSAAIDAYHKAYKLLPHDTLEWEQVENRLNLLDPTREKDPGRGWARSITEKFKLS